jgi:hypothetical protein
MKKDICADAVEKFYPYLDREMGRFDQMKIRWHLRKCEPCAGAFLFQSGLSVVVSQSLSEDCPQKVVERLRSFMKENHKT